MKSSAEKSDNESGRIIALLYIYYCLICLFNILMYDADYNNVILIIVM